MSILRESIERIATQALGADIYFARSYKYRSGLFNPILQTIQGISLADASVLNNIKLYSVGGIKYSLIPPGTEILVAFAGGDPGSPYVAGIDPAAKVVVQFSGVINGIIAGVPPAPAIVPGPITILPNPAVP
jgi:hypothetical protein